MTHIYTDHIDIDISTHMVKRNITQPLSLTPWSRLCNITSAASNSWFAWNAKDPQPFWMTTRPNKSGSVSGKTLFLSKPGKYLNYRTIFQILSRNSSFFELLPETNVSCRWFPLFKRVVVGSWKLRGYRVTRMEHPCFCFFFPKMFL